MLGGSSAWREAGSDGIGRRQSLFREVNERIRELAGSFGLEQVEIVCECGLEGCGERLTLPTTDYERLRLIPTRFAVLAGHEVDALERAVEAHDGYVVAERIGESALAAITADPRRRRS